jgi:hypothetical protein
MTLVIACQGCDKVWREDQVIPLESVPDLLQRIAPGEVVPFGECRECGSLCHKLDVKEAAEAQAKLLAPHLIPKLLEDLDDEIGMRVQHHVDNMVLDYDEITAEVAQRADGYRDDFGAPVDLDELASEVVERLQVTVRS